MYEYITLICAVAEPWLALIERGECFFTQKLGNAVGAHGAKGFIVYNNDDSNPEVIMNISSRSSLFKVAGRN